MNHSKSILLIVDDESSVCRALRRLLRGKADEIVTAETPADARTILETRPITHVLCDHLLGPGQPKGLEIAKQWKKEHSSIKKLIILTGTNVVHDGKLPSGIDSVLPKTTDPEELASILDL